MRVATICVFGHQEDTARPEVSGGPPDTTREPRVLPFAFSYSPRIAFFASASSSSRR